MFFSLFLRNLWILPIDILVKTVYDINTVQDCKNILAKNNKFRR